MQNIDLQYICTVIGNLAGIPVRIFENDKQIFYYSLIHLPKDPIVVYWDEIKNISNHVGYFATRHFNYYGIINSQPYRIVIGPSRQIVNSDQELKELAFRAAVPQEEIPDFVSGMKSIVRMPLESILQMLCTINYILNGEKLSLADISLYESEQENHFQRLSDEIPLRNPAESALNVQEQTYDHNTLKIEQEILHFVRKGDCDALRQWVTSAPAVRGGVLARDQLRQIKNTFIVTVTLVSRAAIQGGMDPQDALMLSDSSIQKCELLPTPDQVTKLMFHTILEFTQRVNRLRIGEKPTELTIAVANYIHHHLSEPITAEDIAHELYISRPYLSAKFKEEAGESITDFVLRVKTDEAKHLLRHTENSIASIGAYLGFSSQSHFSRVFKKYTAHTPGEYRAKYGKVF